MGKSASIIIAPDKPKVDALKRKLEEIMAHHTGQDTEKVRQDMDRDYFMTSEEAVEYGLIDRVIAHR